MHYERIPEINKGILKNKKVVITLGCSFVEAQGSVDQRIWDTYYKQGMSTTVGEWVFTPQQQKEICSEFSDIYVNTFQTKLLNFTHHEVNNSFGHILCKKYFNDEYTCINLGRRGNGNRATIKELYFYPDILWDQIEEIIVIYCPSGPERYDFIDDQYLQINEHARWVTVWPGGMVNQPPYDENSQAMDIVSYGVNKAFYTEKGTILEQIAHVQELLLWCKYKKAKLIITSAFMPMYTKDQFREKLNVNIVREFRRNMKSEEPFTLKDSEVEKVVNMWPWENMFYPNGCISFADLAMHQEKSLDLNACWFYNYMGTGTPDKWITPCAHPSVKAHDLFAKYLYKHITES